MDRIRSGEGDTGAKELACCAQQPSPKSPPVKAESGSELCNMEAQAVQKHTYRYISSCEKLRRQTPTGNAFDALEVSEVDFPEIPPGLEMVTTKPKMPKWTRIIKPKVQMKELSMIVKKEPKEVSNFECRGSEEFLEATIDSGASDSVANAKHASRCRVVPSSGSRGGVRYISASGNVIDNEGEKHVQVETVGGQKRTLKLQIADVTRVLLSVSKICDAGNTVTFTKEGGTITNLVSGQKDHFDRRDDVYRMKFKIVGDGASVFTRPGNQ